MPVIELLASRPPCSWEHAWCWVWWWELPQRRDLSLPVMLDRAWREQCRDLSGEGVAATLPAGYLRASPRGAALGLPGVPGADHRDAEHSAHLLARAPRALRPLRQTDQRFATRWWRP